MASSVSITCPYCHFRYVNKIITKHGAIRCSKCGKTMQV